MATGDVLVGPERLEAMFGGPAEIRRHLIGVVESIRDIQSAPEAGEEGRVELEKLKTDFFKAVFETLEKANNYSAAVDQHAYNANFYKYMLNKAGTGLRQYRQKLRPADARRKAAHDALMSQMDIARRLANLFFSKGVDPDEIPDKFKKIKQRLEKTDFERVEIPANIFSPRNPTLADRGHYAELAKRLREGFIDKDQLLDEIKDAA